MLAEGLQAALPREMYVDAEIWLVEREAVLFGEWFCLGRLDDLGLHLPKRVVAVDVAGESVLVTRTTRARLHAAYNVCRHRGSQVLPTSGSGRRRARPRRCAARTTPGPTG